jgi:hypothetical protein
VNEVQEAVQSRHSMVQFHAVALLHALRCVSGMRARMAAAAAVVCGVVCLRPGTRAARGPLRAAHAHHWQRRAR